MTDLEAIKEKWLKVCPVCDAGYPSTCCHPDEDYRPVILELVREIESLRDQVTFLKNKVADAHHQLVMLRGQEGPR